MRVRATQTVFYNGQDRHTGEEFETLNDLHAKVLMVSGRVVKADSEPQLATSVPEIPETPEKRSRYKRRDMRAEK